MITDPAPLDALLQRFGRINRNGIKDPSPIFICKKSSGNDSKIYPKEIVEKTINVLSNINIIKESELQNLIDKVYPNWLPEQKTEFEDTKTLFRKSLESLQPYSRNKEKEKDFYDKFDGVKVLPIQLYNKYKNLVESGDFISAEGLMVNLHMSTYRSMKFNNQGSMIELNYFALMKNDEIKTQTVLLAKCEYSAEIGLLTNKKYDSIDSDDNFL